MTNRNKSRPHGMYEDERNDYENDFGIYNRSGTPKTAVWQYEENGNGGLVMPQSSTDDDAGIFKDRSNTLIDDYGMPGGGVSNSSGIMLSDVDYGDWESSTPDSITQNQAPYQGNGHTAFDANSRWKASRDNVGFMGTLDEERIQASADVSSISNSERYGGATIIADNMPVQSSVISTTSAKRTESSLGEDAKGVFEAIGNVVADIAAKGADALDWISEKADSRQRTRRENENIEYTRNERNVAQAHHVAHSRQDIDEGRSYHTTSVQRAITDADDNMSNDDFARVEQAREKVAVSQDAM